MLKTHTKYLIYRFTISSLNFELLVMRDAICEQTERFNQIAMLISLLRIIIGKRITQFSSSK